MDRGGDLCAAQVRSICFLVVAPAAIELGWHPPRNRATSGDSRVRQRRDIAPATGATELPGARSAPATEPHAAGRAPERPGPRVGYNRRRGAPVAQRIEHRPSKPSRTTTMNAGVLKIQGLRRFRLPPRTSKNVAVRRPTTGNRCVCCAEYHARPWTRRSQAISRRMVLLRGSPVRSRRPSKNAQKD